MNTLRELIDVIDARFVSGNQVPVPDVRLTADEWAFLRLAAQAARKPAPWEPTDQGRAFLAGSGR